MFVCGLYGDCSSNGGGGQRVANGFQVWVVSAKGTNLRLERGERSVIADTGLIREPGSSGNLPAGEAFFAPMEGTAERAKLFLTVPLATLES
jgi:aminopeptidase